MKILLPALLFLFLANQLAIGQITVPDSTDIPQTDENIPLITLQDADDNGENGGQDISSLLNSSRDPFLTVANFNFNAVRFRPRGYDTENATVFMNGIPVNDLEDERIDYNDWGGLNDVFRNQVNSIGLSPVAFTFGGIAGTTGFDTRASSQRKGIRFSNSWTNRAYRRRMMLTASSGARDKGIAYTFSISRRWADEGYIPGTSYNAWGYFLSLDKKIGEKQMLNLTFFGAPLKRGRSAGTVQEMYDISGSNYYNPNWGYQEGEKRNARIDNIHQPIAILRHDLNLSDKTQLTTAISFQTGRNGTSGLDWYDARDPRPDYYRNLPSYVLDDVQKAAITEKLMSDEAARQINWDYMYNVNYNAEETVLNVNGIEGNNVTGLRSRYIVAESRYDTREINFNTNLQSNITDRFTINGGLGYQYYKGLNFKVVQDLLGGEFFVDIDQFAERDFPDDPESLQNDLNNPNRLVYEGDKYGYNFSSNIRKASAWVQGVLTLKKLDLFLAGSLANTSQWRDGYVVNGRFPDNSFGPSEKQNYLNYGAKAGLTYKLNGRNYFYANAGYLTQPPLFRNAYLSPRTRDQIAEGLTSETIKSGEIGYQLRTPYVKARLTGYYTKFEDRIETTSFYQDELLTFVNYTLTGIDQQHTGVELGIEAKLNPSWTVNGAAAIGQFIYTSRPTATITQDNDASAAETKIIYQQNFNVPSGPQTAYSAGLKYTSKHFWFATLSGSFFSNSWLDFNPDRRTDAAVSYDKFGIGRIEEGSDLWNSIIFQESLPNAWTLDFFASKSIKVGKNTFFLLSLGVNNILDNQFRSGGFEQLRFDFEEKNVNKFPAKYYNAFGRNYFINVGVRI